MAEEMLTLPDRIDSDLGRPKIEQPVADHDRDLSGSEVNAFQYWIKKFGALLGKSDGSSPDGIFKRLGDLEGHSSRIWRWNETDTTQFHVAKDEHSSVSLSKVTTHGPVLRVTFPTKVSGQKATFITITDLALPAVSNMRRFVFRFRLCGASVTASEWYALGPAFLCNLLTGASFYGLGMGAQVATAATGVQATAGAITYSSGSPTWIDLAPETPNFLAVVFEVEMVQTSGGGAAPKWRADFRVTMPGANNSFVLPGLPSSDAAWEADGGMTAFGSTWDSLLLNTLGLCFVGTTGATAGQYFDFDSLEVLAHPLDL